MGTFSNAAIQAMMQAMQGGQPGGGSGSMGNPYGSQFMQPKFQQPAPTPQGEPLRGGMLGSPGATQAPAQPAMKPNIYGSVIGAYGSPEGYQNYQDDFYSMLKQGTPNNAPRLPTAAPPQAAGGQQFAAGGKAPGGEKLSTWDRIVNPGGWGPGQDWARKTFVPDSLEKWSPGGSKFNKMLNPFDW